MRSIILISNTEGCNDFVMGSNFVEIGREQTCDLLIPNVYDQVSRRHASLTWKAEGLFYRQIGKNLAYVNGNIVDIGLQLYDSDTLSLTKDGPEYIISITIEDDGFKFSALRLEFKIAIIMTSILFLILIILLLK